METLIDFIERITRDIPCYSHPRVETKGISLKKYNTMKHGEMGHFATVYERPTFRDFNIIVKEYLADNRSKGDANKRAPRSFGNDPSNPKHAGLVFYVEKDSTGQDYQRVFHCLQVIRNHPSL